MQVSGKKTVVTECSGMKNQKLLSYKTPNINALQLQLRITPNKENRFIF